MLTQNFMFHTGHKPIYLAPRTWKRTTTNGCAQNAPLISHLIRLFMSNSAYPWPRKHHACSPSWLPLPEVPLDWFVNITGLFNKAPVTFTCVSQDTERHLLLPLVKRYLHVGLPENAPAVYMPFRNCMLELSLQSGWLMWGARFAILERLRLTILEELHAVHLEVNKMKSLTSVYIWWAEVGGDSVTRVGCRMLYQESRNDAPRYRRSLGTDQKCPGDLST